MKNKFLLNFLLFNFLFLMSHNYCVSQTNAPSLWLSPPKLPQGDIMLQDVMVPIDTDAEDTYYSVLNWNAGTDGGGYCGLQNNGSGDKLTIFSIWDPTNGDTSTSIVYATKGLTFTRFNEETSGWHAIKDSMWIENNYYTLVTRRWDVGTHTYFGYWIESVTDTSWTHILTIDYPLPNVYFNANNSGNAFIEDWIGNGYEMRKAYYKNGYKRNNITYDYDPFTPYDFNFTEPLNSDIYNKNWNVGIVDDAIFLQTGGNTTTSLLPEQNYTWALNTPSKPAKPIIDFKIDSIDNQNIYWSVPKTTTPQFKYSIEINDSIETVIAPEVRSCAYNNKENKKILINLTLEDVLGNLTTKTFLFAPKITPTLSVSNDSIKLPYQDKSTTEFSILSNTNWKISNSQSWINLNTLYGYDTAVITLNAEPNLTNYERIDTIIISDSMGLNQNIVVIQAPADSINNLTESDIAINDNNIQVFPVPVKNHLNISIKNNNNYNYSIYNLNGSIVYTSSTTNSLTTLDMSDYSSGLYIVELKNLNETIIKKIIKE